MPTIKDVARASGVCAATVSQVLNNGRRPVNTRTRERIMAVAREMEYRPNAIARGLVRKRMNTVGLVFVHSNPAPDPSAFLISVLSGVLGVNTVHRQNTTLCTIADWNDSLTHVHDLCDGRCDGVLLLVPPADCPLIDALRQRKLPFVVVSGTDSTELASQVDIDHAAAARAMTENLLAMGHRRIAFVYEPYHASFAFLQKRLEGWRAAMASAGIAEEFLRTTTVEGSVALLEETAPPTAFFVSHDADALWLIGVLRRAGHRVPDDISVVGFDDIPGAAAATPPLTTVRQPATQIGEAAARMLLGLIDGTVEAGTRALLPTEIIHRQSVAPRKVRRDGLPRTAAYHYVIAVIVRKTVCSRKSRKALNEREPDPKRQKSLPTG